MNTFDINKKLIEKSTGKYYLQISNSGFISIYKRMNGENVSKNIDSKGLDTLLLQSKINNYFFDDPVDFLKSLILELSSKQLSLFDSDGLDLGSDSSNKDLEEFYEFTESKENLVSGLYEQISDIFKNNSLTKGRLSFSLGDKGFLKEFNKGKNKTLEIELITSYKKNFDLQLKEINKRTNGFSSNYVYKIIAKYGDFEFFEKVGKNFSNQDELLEDLNFSLFDLANLYFGIEE